MSLGTYAALSSDLLNLNSFRAIEVQPRDLSANCFFARIGVSMGTIASKGLSPKFCFLKLKFLFY